MKRKILLLSLAWLSAVYAQAQPGGDTATPLRKIPSLYAIVLSVRDTIRYDQHFNGTSENDVFDDQSLTKSVGCLLIGIAIDKGYISSLDEKIVYWFPELKRDTDRRKQEITLRQVMNQASGLYHEDLTAINGIPDFLALTDPAGYVLHAPLLSAPGMTFLYNNAATHLLSLILTKSTGMDVRTFAEKYLLGPLDIHILQWEKMKDGYYDLSGLQNIRLRTADMIRIGSLLLNGGQYGGRQVIPKAWIDQILHPDILYDTEWGFQPSRYALCWYHTRFRGSEMIYGMGWGGQFLIIVPALQMVMAINQSHEDDKAPRQSGRFTEAIFPLFYEKVSDGTLGGSMIKNR